MEDRGLARPGGSPEHLLAERWTRLRTAVACGLPDRVPLALNMDAFAARTMGIKMSDFVADVDLASGAVLSTMEKLGDVDAIQVPVVVPSMLGALWLSPAKLPGRDLPEDSLWQADEQVRMQPEDYDLILQIGWQSWFAQYAERYLGDMLAAIRKGGEAGARWKAAHEQRGYAVFSPAVVDHPFEHLCGARSVKEFMLDLFHLPNKVQAVLDAIMDAKRDEMRARIRSAGRAACWVGGWRTAPEFLSPRLWNRFVWPHMKELIEMVAEEGAIPVLHYDANWDREIERLGELPANTCVLALDGKTDIFRAKKIIAGHMCLLGDVPPALLTLGTVDEVRRYCDRLLTEVGPEGFIMAMGCAIPPDAKFENVQAMVDSVKRA
jgi:hypothetical protein